MLKASIIADRTFKLAEIDRRIFGGFVEHMGRCVYTGIFEPGHPTADENGFRQDVADLTKELGITVMRYPGGNFLSGYDWEDGIGPREQRPKRLDLAWSSVETNQFGTDEFALWCKKTGIEPMFGVNLGTGTPDDARHMIEYCNHPGGTEWSDRRRANGHEAPHAVNFWCLGNEMDGPWQICAKTAEEYGRIAQETAKVMRLVDPSITLAACGSSNREMKTYARWEYEVLDHCFDYVDFISLHTYFTNPTGSTADFLANIERLDVYLNEVAAIADAVAATRRSNKKIMLSLDEWNVWYKARSQYDMRKPGWPEAPPLIEEVYNAEDALLIGGALITLLNNADRVKCACIAQLVNVIGPIMTKPGGGAWRQTIFHPFALTAKHARGNVLLTKQCSPAHSNDEFDEIPYLVAAVTENDTGGACILALNRHLEEPMQLDVELRQFANNLELVDAQTLHHADLKAVNSEDNRNEVAPRRLPAVSIDGNCLKAELPPASWNIILLQ